MFRMTVQDVFSIKRRGLVATGQVESGTVRVGDELQIDGLGTTRVKALEMFRKKLDEARSATPSAFSSKAWRRRTSLRARSSPVRAEAAAA